jgi:hypothetical protein
MAKRKAPQGPKSTPESAAHDNNEFMWSKETLELMWSKEILQHVRHEFRGVIDNLTAILATINASRSSPEKIAKLVSSAENDLLSLIRLADSMRDALNSPIIPPAMVANENLYKLTKVAIATLGRAARGVKLRLSGNKTVECLCERLRFEFLLTSILRFLLRAPRDQRPTDGIRIVIDEDEKFARVEITFNFSIRWESDRDDDRNLNWRVITRLINTMDGFIDPPEFGRISNRLDVVFWKRSAL